MDTARGSCSRYCLLIVLLCELAVAVYGEAFYTRRDHSDVEIAAPRAPVVEDKNTALALLEKWGYRNCKPDGTKRRRRRDLSLPIVIGEGQGRTDSDEGKECLSFEESLKRYQEYQKLAPTKVLDEETKRRMNLLRCGNPDFFNDTPLDEIPPDDLALSPDTFAATTTEAPTQAPTTGRRKRRSIVDIISTSHSYPFSAADRRRHEHYESSIVNNPRRKRDVHWKERLMGKHKHTLGRKRRHKRSIVKSASSGSTEDDIFNNTMVFNKTEITWRILKNRYSRRIPNDLQEMIMKDAFRRWSEVIPLNFFQDDHSDIKQVDIQIAFGTGWHLSCKRQFDGMGSEMAHSWRDSNQKGHIHFDDDENYIQEDVHNVGINLLTVAVHEIGHVLGLAHTPRYDSVMYSVYKGTHNIELPWHDRQAIQQLYGVCRGKFDLIMDYVKYHEKKWVFNTYFFRNDHFWMYENQENRTRYGDPKYTSNSWKGLPSQLDAYVHAWSSIGNVKMFFGGDKFWIYSDVVDSVYPGTDGRLINEAFNTNTSDPNLVLPNNLDTAYYDFRDQKIYFFKGDKVWTADPVWNADPRIPQFYTVDSVSLISEKFPPYAGDFHYSGKVYKGPHRALPNNLDTAYYCFVKGILFFFHGEDVYINAMYNLAVRHHIVNGIVYLGKWYELDSWFDICDV
ncbi:unnamed protein product [Owenia fusiformis]|uniref:Uncharacterized protein n=1 Tax=Owenia fusiformis TaxID=6347 RepID=A0A8J1T5E5_OWEFU|nr:unnamed protein product [Owenia fusiformis]